MTDLDDKAILIVDDEEISLTILRRLLKAQGFSRIITALNANQAINIIKRVDRPFFLVISDQFMPEMTGTDFLAQVIVLSPDTRRIIMTGLADAAIVVEALNKGAVHKFIPKPWDNRQLVEIVLGELDLFEKVQEKKRLNSIIASQNSQLFRYASTLKAKEKLFALEIASRQKNLSSLKLLAETLHKKQGNGMVMPGLNDLLSKTIVISAKSMGKAFEAIRAEIEKVFYVLAEKTGTPFNPDEKSTDTAIIDADEIYALIDNIISHACKAATPALKSIDQVKPPKEWIDAYDHIPDLLELALADGFISQKDGDKARIEMACLPDSHKSSQSFLLERNLISRKDLSRIKVKQSLIKTRLKDRESAKKLVETGAITAQEMETMLRQQVKHSRDTGELVTLSDLIFMEKGVRIPMEGAISAEKVSDNNLTAQETITENGSPAQGVSLTVSQDKTRAVIQVPKAMVGRCSVSSIMEMLYEHDIQYGVVDEKLIEGFLKYRKDPEKKFVVAMGVEPIEGKHAQINYFFDTQYQTAGIVAEDGTIDFMDRGKIPHVPQDFLLAEKVPRVQGRMGRDIFGDPIPVNEVRDVVLKAGLGTRLSHNGLELYSTVEGQPSLSSLNVVSVSKELVIKGDVDFETGHIDFKGNVVVFGMVKEGFQVKCVNLTVNEIHGGQIELAGDLKVSTGIIDSSVKVMGGVKAKFINNSTITAFGDVLVIQEIMGSEIVTGGEIINKKGRVTGSSLAAKMGMDLGMVGTSRSRISILRVGVNDYLASLMIVVDQKINAVESELKKALMEQQELEEKNFTMHKEVANHSFIQEKLSRSLETLKKQNSTEQENTGRIQNSKKIKEIDQELGESDKIIKSIFQAQDKLMKTIEGVEKRIQELTSQADEQRLEKEEIQKVASQKKAIMEVKVHKEIVADTRILTSQSSMIVKPSLGPCRIVETASADPEKANVRQLSIQVL